MKFLSFSVGGQQGWGMMAEDGVADLRQRFAGKYATLAEFIGSADFARRNMLQDIAADYRLEDVTLLPVIPNPEKIVCLVRNYMDHHKEIVASGQAREVTGFPPIFLRVARSLAAHGQALLRPRESESFDWEGEMALIIGKPGRRIAEAEAMAHVAGYACFNDGSVREWQFHANQIAAGKNFVRSGGFGPWMVTADEIADPGKLKLETRINGEVVQASDTSHLIFGIPRIINYCSSIFDLVPGDVIVTGTPAGVGWGRDPKRFMRAGDLVEVEIEGLGTLRNPVEDD